MKWRRAARAQAQLEVTLPGFPNSQSIKLTARISGSATFSLDGMTPARRLVVNITGRTDFAIRDSADIESLSDRCLEDFCRNLTLYPVWLAHKALCSHASECSAWYGPDDLPEQLRETMRLVAQHAYRLSRFPQSSRIVGRLQSNDPRALDEIEQRLREIIGAPIAAKDLPSAAQTVLRSAQSDYFLEDFHFPSRDGESTRHVLDNLFGVERFEDFVARWATYGDPESTSDGERNTSWNPAWREKLTADLPKARKRLEEDWNRERKPAMTLVSLCDPHTSQRLQRFLEHTGQATFEPFARAACEVAELWSDASAAHAALADTMARVSATSAELPVPMHELQSVSSRYLQSFARTRQRIRQAERELADPIRALYQAQYEHVTREVEELLACLEQRPALEAGLRVGAVLASIVALRDISRRVLCRLIARQLDVLSYTP